MFEKRRRRRESHNAVERRRRDNINDKIQGKRKKKEIKGPLHPPERAFTHTIL
jgi:hypothetical protein